jgi:hypothetical protein
MITPPTSYPGSKCLRVEAPFAVYQSGQEGSSRLFATGLYCDRIIKISEDGGLKFRDRMVPPDTFAGPSLLATPL